MSHKLYVIVDKTLSKSQQAVQACHASIEFAKKYPEWKHQSLVLIGVETKELEDFYLDCNTLPLRDKVKHAAFFESYWDDRLTAVACYGCDERVKEFDLL